MSMCRLEPNSLWLPGLREPGIGRMAVREEERSGVRSAELQRSVASSHLRAGQSEPG